MSGRISQPPCPIAPLWEILAIWGTKVHFKNFNKKAKTSNCAPKVRISDIDRVGQAGSAPVSHRPLVTAPLPSAFPQSPPKGATIPYRPKPQVAPPLLLAGGQAYTIHGNYAVPTPEVSVPVSLHGGLIDSIPTSLFKQAALPPHHLLPASLPVDVSDQPPDLSPLSPVRQPFKPDTQI